MVYLSKLVKMRLLERLSLFLGTCALLGQEDSLDVGQDTTLGNGHTSQELVQLFIIPKQETSDQCNRNKLNLPDGQLKVPWDNARLLVVPGSIASQLEDLSSQVLHDSCHVDWSPCTHPLGIVPFSNETKS